MLDDFKVWGFMILTIIVKLLLSPTQSLIRAAATVSAGVLSALVFTEPTLTFFNLDRDVYLILVVCFWALVGENVLRRILDIIERDDLLMVIFDKWRGKS